jgi:hypothetical protein
VGAAVQLDVGRSGDEAFDVEGGEGDEVVLVPCVEVEERMADLLEMVSLDMSLWRLKHTLTLMVVLKEAFCAL